MNYSKTWSQVNLDNYATIGNLATIAYLTSEVSLDVCIQDFDAPKVGKKNKGTILTMTN